ncbi:reverse transcriptase domain-containing protein, partial [Streptomyces sp. IBSBF 2390]|uniref:reverse transcriptase domain-containing protein n=1 Tax=Streptomyces sp. IBSBF 2390 TaxID=2903533 RepID=UPI002FDBBA9E
MELGIPKRLILLCQMTLAETKSAVRISQKASDPFDTTHGFRQGDALSCDLFNICLEMIVRRANIRTSSSIITKSVQLLAYADDIDIVARNVEDLKASYENISRHAASMGLRVNIEKTKYMKSSRNTPQPNNITIGADEFESVKDFIYLGSSVNTENDVTQEIKRRIMLANRTLFGLGRVLRSRFVRRGTKLKIYKTLVIPVLIYGAESWTLSESDKNLLRVFERKVLRLIFGPVCVNNEWRIRYNHELYALYADSSIVDRVSKQQLRWLGHVWRMSDDAPPKKIAQARPEGSRKPGRQKLRWLDCMEAELTSKGITNWTTETANRGRWRQILSRF